MPGVGRQGRGRQNQEETRKATRPCSTWEGVSPRVGAPHDAGRRFAIVCGHPTARRAFPHGTGRHRAGHATRHGMLHRGDRSLVSACRCGPVTQGRSGSVRGWRSSRAWSGPAPRPTPGGGRAVSRSPGTAWGAGRVGRGVRVARAGRCEAGGWRQAKAPRSGVQPPPGTEALQACPARRGAPEA